MIITVNVNKLFIDDLDTEMEVIHKLDAFIETHYEPFANMFEWDFVDDGRSDWSEFEMEEPSKFDFAAEDYYFSDLDDTVRFLDWPEKAKTVLSEAIIEAREIYDEGALVAFQAVRNEFYAICNEKQRGEEESQEYQEELELYLKENDESIRKLVKARLELKRASSLPN